MLRDRAFRFFLFLIPVSYLLFFPVYASLFLAIAFFYFFFLDKERLLLFSFLVVLLFFISLLKFYALNRQADFEGKVVASDFGIVLSQKKNSYQSVLRVLTPLLKTPNGKAVSFFRVIDLRISGLNRNLTGWVIKYKGILSKQKVYRNRFCTNYYSLVSSGNLYFVKIKDAFFVEKKGKIGLLSIDGYLLKYYEDYRVKGFLSALIFGKKHELDYSLGERAKRLGIYHLFVLSGFHFGIFYLILKFLLFPIPLRKRYKDALILVILFFVLLITAFSSPSLRVYFMLSVYLLFSASGIKVRPSDAVGLAGILMLFFNPFNALNAGFLMSFVLSGGIVLFVEEKGFLFSFFSVPFIAFFLLLPFYLYFFNYIPLLSPLVNIVLIPLIVVLFWLFFLNILTFGLLGFFVSRLSLFVIRLIDLLPSFSFDVYPPFFLFLSSVAVVLLFFFVKRKLLLYACGILLVLLAVIVPSQARGNFVSFLDAGKSTPVLVKFGEYSAFVDTGDSYFSSVCLPRELNYYGLKKIDFLILRRVNSRVLNRVEDICRKIEVKNLVVEREKAKGANLFRLEWIKNFFGVNFTMLERGKMGKFKVFYVEFEKTGFFLKAGKTLICFGCVWENRNCDFCLLKKKSVKQENLPCTVVVEGENRESELFFSLEN